jgi:hypothetical protein
VDIGRTKNGWKALEPRLGAESVDAVRQPAIDPILSVLSPRSRLSKLHIEIAEYFSA